MVNTSKIFLLQCFIALDRHIYNSQRQSLCLYIWFSILSNNSAHSQHDDFFGSCSTKFPKVLHRKLWYLHWILQSLTTEDLGAVLSILMIQKSLLQTQPGSTFFAFFFFFYKRFRQVPVSYNKSLIPLLLLLLFIEWYKQMERHFVNWDCFQPAVIKRQIYVCICSNLKSKQK